MLIGSKWEHSVDLGESLKKHLQFCGVTMTGRADDIGVRSNSFNKKRTWNNYLEMWLNTFCVRIECISVVLDGLVSLVGVKYEF